MVHSRKPDEAGAASSVVAFLVAGVVFIGSVGALLLASQDSSDGPGHEAADAATLRLQSESLADLLVGSPGFHLSSDPTVCGAQTPPCYVEGWTPVNADELGRLGLRQDGSALMDFDKFENLRRAGLASSSTDDRVNYPDARESLGLDATDLDFHVRAFPSLRSVRDLLATGERDPNLRVTYLADYQKTNGGPAVSLSYGAMTCTPVGSAYRLSFPVTNNGLTDTMFIGVFDADLGGAEYADRTRTYVLPHSSGAASTSTLTIDVPAVAGRDCVGQVDVELRDVKSRLARLSFTLTAPGTAGSAAASDLWVNPGKTYYTQGQDVLIEFDGDLPRQNNDLPVTVALTVAREDGTVVYPVGSDPTSTTVTRTVRSITVPAARFDSAVTTKYVATLSYAAAGITLSDRVVVLPAGTAVDEYDPSGSVSYIPAPNSVAAEAGFLEDLVDRFCPYEVLSTTALAIDAIDLHKNDVTDAGEDHAGRCAFKGTTALGADQPGDVLPDLQDFMNNVLPLRLVDPTGTGYTQQCNGNVVGKPRFDITRVLVVGSNVDHNAMTSAAAKYAVCEWVMAGGTMIVFGSEDQHVAWLEPIFKAAITSSSNPVSTPDPSHPILNRADSLSYDGYRSNGTQVWSFNGQTAADQALLLNNVVTSGSDSILTVSNPGAFGNGTIILTTWLPYDLFTSPPGAGGSEAEGLALVNNFLMQGYRDLFLDYGPSIPSESRQAAAAQRVVDIQHPEFDDPITLTLFVYVF